MPHGQDTGNFAHEAARWLAAHVVPPDQTVWSDAGWFDDLFGRLRPLLDSRASAATDQARRMLVEFRSALALLQSQAAQLERHFGERNLADPAEGIRLFEAFVGTSAQAVDAADRLTSGPLREVHDAVVGGVTQPDVLARWGLLIDGLEQTLVPNLRLAWEYGGQLAAALPAGVWQGTTEPRGEQGVDSAPEPAEQTRDLLAGWLAALEGALRLVHDAVAQVSETPHGALSPATHALPAITPLVESVRAAEHTVRHGILDEARQATDWTFEQSAGVLDALLRATVQQLDEIATHASRDRSPLTIRKQDQHVQRLVQLERVRREAVDLVAQWVTRAGDPVLDDTALFDDAAGRAADSLNLSRPADT